MKTLKHRFLLLSILNGEVRVEPGPEIPGVLQFIADPTLTRGEWRDGTELLSHQFLKGGGDSPLERLDRAAGVTARPGLTARSVQLLDVDDVGAVRVKPHMGEFATICRLNLVVNVASLFGENRGSSGAAYVLEMLRGFGAWFSNAPFPFENVQAPQPKSAGKGADLAQRVSTLEQRVSAIDAPASSPVAPQRRH